MKNKRILCSLLSAAMVLSLAACSSGETAGSGSAASTADSASASAEGGSAEGEDGYTTVTVFCPNTSSMPMTNETAVVQVLSEKTKTNFDFVNSPTTGTEEKFNLMMASGDIPDLVIYTQDPILEYTRAFAPLNDLIEEYCPNYAQLMEENCYCVVGDEICAQKNIPFFICIIKKGLYLFGKLFSSNFPEKGRDFGCVFHVMPIIHDTEV